MARVKGSLQVSNQVFADLAGYAAMSCYGVVGMAHPDLQNHLHLILQLGQLRNGVEVEMEDDKMLVVLHVVVDAKVNMRSVAQNLKSSVEFMLQRIAKVDNVEVEVVIEGVRSMGR